MKLTPRQALWWTIGVSTALRLVWSASLEPGNDEAYHALFPAHPDWSYFDHPPMLAWIAAAGWAVAGKSSGAWGLRLGFVALSSGSTWILARLTRRTHGEAAAAWAAFLFNASGYFGLASGAFVLPDGPLVFFWLLTLDRLVSAFDRPLSIGRWLAVGLAWGAALLSKYHAALLPLGVLAYLAMVAEARPVLRTIGPWAAIAIGLLIFSPVIAWNARHGWVSFAFQGSRALGDGRGPRIDGLAAGLLGQALYVFPWIWLDLAIAGIAAAVRMPFQSRAERFLIAQAAVPLVLFNAAGSFRPILPHWPLVGLLAIYPFLGAVWVRRVSKPAWRRRAVWIGLAPVVLAVATVGHARFGIFQDLRGRPFGAIPIEDDPTLDLLGWDRIADELRNRGILRENRTFLFTGQWYRSAQLSFALGRSDRVACYSGGDARGFAFWSRPQDWIGRDGVLVAFGPDSVEPACFDRYFERIEPLSRLKLVRGGVAVREARLYRCIRQIRPFPFDRSNLRGRSR